MRTVHSFAAIAFLVATFLVKPAAGASQTITFDSIPDQIFGVSPFPIAAQSSSLLPVGFKSTTPAVCKISDDLVTLLKTGTCSITASQSGNTSYSAASAARSFTVSAAKPSNSFFGSSIAVPNGVSYVTEGDIIGTGVPDLLVLNAYSDPLSVACMGALPTTLTVMKGNGSGRFVPGNPLNPFTALLPNGAPNPVALAVGDFNGDGFQDLAVANPSSSPYYDFMGCAFGGGPGEIQVLLGDGAGNFTSPASPPVLGQYSNPVSLAVGDFNGDGIQDLAVADSANTVWVLLGDGAGNFTISSSISVSGPVSVVVGDFNGDGSEDLAVATTYVETQDFMYVNGFITVLLGDGSGGFTTAKGSPFAMGTTPVSLVVGDFDADGKQDVAAANTSNNVAVLLGDGSGGFTPTTGSPFAAGAGSSSLVVGDFNGDGKQDLALTDFGTPQLSQVGNTVTVLLGDGSGGFKAAARSPFAVGAGPVFLVVGDFNGDGIEDLATANIDSGNVTVLLGYLEGSTPQTIAFGALPVQNLGSTPPALSAIASSGLAVMFTSNSTSVCTVSGVDVTLVTTGTCSITASQPGNPTFAAAAPVTRTFTVSAGPPAIVSLSPQTGAGASATFKLVYSDPNGAGDLSEALLQINAEQSSGNACYVYYQPQENHLYLANNAGNVWMTPALTPGVAGTASNSQCKLNAGSSSVTSGGNDLTLTVELTFSGTFAGSKNVYLYAAGLSGQNSGWVKEGTWLPASAGPPAVVLLSPDSGAGTSATFKAVYSDPNGAADLRTVLMQMNTNQSGANACYVYYQPQGNHLYLANNAGNVWITPALTPGVAGTASNSQCTLNAAASSVTAAGNDLTLNVALSFIGTFVDSRNVYLYAAGFSGQNSGWAKGGTWTPNPTSTPPAIVSLSPDVGAGTSVKFKAVFSDPNGAGDLSEVLLQVNAVQSSANACYVYYQPQGNHLYLANNAGSAWMTPALVPGVGGTASNSQCTLNALASSVTTVGNDLNLTVEITFNGTFVGKKNAYLYGAGFSGKNSGWVKEGNWIPNPIAEPPAIVSLSPNSGTGTSVTFKAAFSDPNGAGDLSEVLLQVNAVQSSANACYVYYQPQGNLLYLANNAGAFMTPALTPGVAGTANNSQCTLNAGASSVTTTGNDLTLNIAVTFGAFVGAKNVYLYAAGLSGQKSGWVDKGTWVP